jgi:hypothetical protein
MGLTQKAKPGEQKADGARNHQRQPPATSLTDSTEHAALPKVPEFVPGTVRHRPAEARYPSNHTKSSHRAGTCQRIA